MFDTTSIQEHMDVVDAAGQPVGKVDSVQADVVKLTRNDSADGMHHYLGIDMIDRVEGAQIHLREGVSLPEGLHSGADMSASGEQDFAAGYSGKTEQSGSQDQLLFGTSGHGTGMGGSGPV